MLVTVFRGGRLFQALEQGGMTSRQLRGRDDVLFARSFILTIALVILAISLSVFWIAGQRELQGRGLVLTVGLILAIPIMILAFLGPRRSMERWAEIASSHELMAVPLLLAYPVYRIWRLMA